jgi:hypothetical protein
MVVFVEMDEIRVLTIPLPSESMVSQLKAIVVLPVD